TIALTEVLQILAIHWRGLTGGSEGVSLPNAASVWTMTFDGRRTYAFVGLGFLLLAVFVTWLIERSRWGYYLVAIREAEDAARAASCPGRARGERAPRGRRRLQALRRPRGRARRGVRDGRGRAGRAHRPQRRGQDHAVLAAQRVPASRRGADPLRGRGPRRADARAPLPAGSHPLVPARQALRQPDGGGERDGRGLRARGHATRRTR